ncbi:hypothetical protein IGB42_01610 [Andreprevotia sp. IGB-42]|uniref:TnsD family Tn7-like transposition protein n=1 Tax=Andreprevotia sp. IGB-42 TaxID=2497473 RepID=UPI0013575F88|nr:TnsD family Tn7-like transposition protein [Andreprevotia sp. IGB-42]KAF0813931.1 hypothetical protein IGB42_01610 [Andreprevotia sp. IGB-42]
MSTLAYFPAPHPDELLYSLLARYRCNVGMPGVMHTLDGLFGNRHVVAAYDLPGHLAALASRLPSGVKFDVNELIDRFTLFHYYTAFVSAGVRQQARKAMMEGAASAYVRLGMTAFRIRRLTHLRFCPACRQQMLTEHGELYWRRIHQLEGILVCAEHGCVLCNSQVEFASGSRHELVAATVANCSAKAQPVVVVSDAAVLPQLKQLAMRCAELLQNPPAPQDPIEWTEFYRQQMARAGFFKLQATIHQQRFLAAFHSKCDAILAYFPQISGCDDWLIKLVRKQRTAIHPYCHAMLQHFLELEGLSRQPFGQGPWCCLNPLAKHVNSQSITKVQMHRNQRHHVGVFECECGYAYTRNINPTTGKISPPRFLRYGPMLEPVLRRLREEGWSLRAQARLLHLDPKTVSRLGRELDISSVIPPSRASITDVYALSGGDIRKADGELRSKKKTVIRASPLRIDWQGLDHRLARKLEELALAMRDMVPLRQLTASALERALGYRGWLINHRHQLPLTIAKLTAVIERTEDFQLRRVQWVINEHSQKHIPLQVWRILRAAGLPSAHRTQVEVILGANLLPSNVRRR